MRADDLGLLTAVQDEQATWSWENFGEQPDVNPLLGIGEELGEFYEATKSKDKLDALCDVAIYSMDYATRRRWNLAHLVEAHSPLIADNPTVQAMAISDCPLMVALGRLNHAHLKEAQGIRGDASVHQTAAKEALAAIFLECAAEFYVLPQASKLSFVEAISIVWSRVVEKRNWKKNPGGKKAKAAG